MTLYAHAVRDFPVGQKNAVGREGQLRLHFGWHDSRTTMVESYFRTPLQVMRPIPHQAGCLGVYLLSPTGGVVQHDRYDIQITLDAHTHALITTVAATKIYRMPQGRAIQHVTIEVGEQAILEFVPDALILFAEADFAQFVTIKLHKGAVCLFQDSVMGGRVAHRQEFLQFRRFHNQIEICDEDGPIVYEALRLRPMEQPLSRLGLLDEYTCWGSAYLVGDLSRWQCEPKTFCQAVNATQPEGVLASISELDRAGLAYRLLANRLESMEQALEQLRCHFRQALDKPFAPLRK